MIDLNPNDPDLLAHFGMRLTYTERGRGVALLTKAIAPNSAHPPWYLNPITYFHYQTRDYEQAFMDFEKDTKTVKFGGYCTE